MIELLERLHLAQKQIVAVIRRAAENHRFYGESLAGRRTNREVH
jgi:hypothetical protein